MFDKDLYYEFLGDTRILVCVAHGERPHASVSQVMKCSNQSSISSSLTTSPNPAISA
jgi:hypothetical protein